MADQSLMQIATSNGVALSEPDEHVQKGVVVDTDAATPYVVENTELRP